MLSQCRLTYFFAACNGILLQVYFFSPAKHEVFSRICASGIRGTSFGKGMGPRK